MRVGGVDILLDSLAKQTFTDFEIVLVDAVGARRRDLVTQAARDRFLSVVHVAIDPMPAHCSFCGMANLGVVHSSGEVLLFAVDYSSFPPDLLAKHARFHKADPTGKAGMMGPHRYLHLNAAPGFPIYDRNDINRYEQDFKSGALDPFMISAGRHGSAHGMESEPHQADGGAIVPWDADPKLRLPAGPIGPEFFHAKNESVRRQRVIEIDGWDEDLDGAHLYQDSDFSDRLAVKAGVSWLLDPSAVVDIVNPRHLFPFARRTRPHEDNKRIWESKKAAGYPSTKERLVGIQLRSVENDPSVGMVAEKRLRVAMVYGEFSSAIHGPFDIDGLYTRTGLTGSESSFFNLARTLSERGNEVVVFCNTLAEADHESGFKALPIRMLERFHEVQGVDAMIAWNEPDYLRFAPPGTKRYCDQQLNDFGYAGGGWYAQTGMFMGPPRQVDWRTLVDRWVSPSNSHMRMVMGHERIPLDHCTVIPNSVDLGLFSGPSPVRNPNLVVWCSSPDRGLHHLLSLWPDVKRQVPAAELRIFYRLAPWIARVRNDDDACGRRARYIEDALPKLAALGVTVVDLVPNAQMASELRSAACLAYTCDPLNRYTEGFGCSVLDAAAGGCVPIISAADALPEVHGSAVIGIPGPVQERREDWIKSIVGVLRGLASPLAGPAMKAHAEKHSREKVADLWEALLRS